jgi:hypothetical protein
MHPFRIEGQAEIDSIIHKKLHLVLLGGRANLRGEFELLPKREIFFSELNRRDARAAGLSDDLGQGTAERFCAITDQVDFKVD